MGCGWWGGWRVVGVLVLGSGFRVGSGSGVGVSGGWGCLSGGSWFLVGVWCDVWGSVPLRPLLNSPPRPLGVLWFLVRVVPLLGGVAVCCWLSCGLQFFSGGVGWSCGWLVLLAVFWSGCSQREGCGCCSCWLLRFGRLFVGGWLVVAGSVGCVSVGGLFCCWLCCSRWVGRPGRSGSSSPPSFSPHGTRQAFPTPRIRWGNSHVKTLTD